MTGSLQEKCGKYYAVLNTYDPNGKRKLKWIATGLEVKGNKRKAEKRLREILTEYERQHPATESEMLFSDFIKVWLEVAALRVDIITYQVYEVTADTHVIPYFKALGTRLVNVTHEILQEYFNHKHKAGRIDGKGGLSAKTLRHHKNIIMQTLTEGVKRGLILSNPCQFVILPQLERNEYQFYTADQLKDLYTAIRDEPLLPLVKLTALYGLRRSELLGLKWDSVNLDADTVTIKHTVSHGTRTVEKDKTKNRSSYRSFPLTDEARQIILDAQHREQVNSKLFGDAYFENDYIFKWPDGHPYAPTFITHKFVQLLQKHNLPHIRFHELRHSCASNLIALGFSLKDVQEWLGHADIKLTANIYSHLDVTRKKGIAEALNDSLNTQKDAGKKCIRMTGLLAR